MQIGCTDNFGSSLCSTSKIRITRLSEGTVFVRSPWGAEGGQTNNRWRWVSPIHSSGFILASSLIGRSPFLFGTKIVLFPVVTVFFCGNFLRQIKAMKNRFLDKLALPRELDVHFLIFKIYIFSELRAKKRLKKLAAEKCLFLGYFGKSEN